MRSVLSVMPSLSQVLPALAYPLNMGNPLASGPATKGDNSSVNGMGCLQFMLLDDAALTTVGSLGPPPAHWP